MSSHPQMIHSVMIISSAFLENKHPNFRESLESMQRISAASRSSPVVFISSNRELPKDLYEAIQQFLQTTP